MCAYKNTYTESHLLAIGIDKYFDPALTPLGNAENDARKFADLMTQAPYNFTSHLLLGSEATKQALQDAIADLYGTDPDSRIMVYFAGHGYTIVDNFGHETGYLACFDTVPDRHHTALRLEDLTDLRRYANAKHIVFILDSCFSGKALGMTTLRSAADRFLERRAYQVLTAGAGDQAVADTKSMTRLLLNEIEPSKATGLLRLSSVGIAVQDQMARDTKSTQIPQFGHLEGSQGGDFVLYLAEDYMPGKRPVGPILRNLVIECHEYGKTLPVMEVESDVTIQELTDAAMEEASIAGEYSGMLLRKKTGTRLASTQTLLEAGVEDNEILLLHRSSTLFDLKIEHTPTGKIIPIVQVNGHATIKELIDTIGERLGLSHPAMLKHKHSSKLLQPEQTLFEAGIRDGDTLEMKIHDGFTRIEYLHES